AENCGVFIVFLIGWVDDRSSPLHQIRIVGRNWVGSLDVSQLGRWRRADVDASLAATEQRLFGFWALAIYHPETLEGDVCSIEIVLTDGGSRSIEVTPQHCTEREIRDRVGGFLDSVHPVDRLLPNDGTSIKRVLGRAISDSGPVVPRNRVE